MLGWRNAAYLGVRYHNMKEKSTEILIIGTSLYAISLAISLGKKGKDVLLLECIEENVVRGFFKIDRTPLNESPIEGHLFFDMCTELFNKYGVEYSLNYWGINKVSFNYINSVFSTIGHDFEIESKKIIYSPNQILDFGQPPLTLEKAEKLLWFGCAWSDGYFYRNKKSGVYGNGSWAANQALMANHFENEVTIYNPDELFIADDYLLHEIELNKINVINDCKNLNLICNSDNKLEAVEYEIDESFIQDECKIIYEGRSGSSYEQYLSTFPKVENFNFHIRNSQLFQHSKEFEHGMQ